MIGNSGVGKSTLINSVLGEERAETGWGIKGTTEELSVFDAEMIPFRIIDSVGFEPSPIKARKAIDAVKKWLKNSAREGHNDTQINVIWFCVDGTAGKLFSKTIEDFSKATSILKTVPIIVVITKSYSVPDREQNVEMVTSAFSQQKRYSNCLRAVIPVVASTFVLNETAYAAPEGITELIDATNELMPEGVKAGEQDIAVFKLKRRRVMAHGITGISTTAAVVVGAVPIPFTDAAILAPLEITLVNALAQIYGISKNEMSKKFLNSIIEVGTVSIAAKSAISALKAIPGLNLAASVINAIIAGSFVAAIGEGTIYAFEQVYLGNKSVTDIDWVKKVMETKLSSQFIDIVKTITDKTNQNTDNKAIGTIIKNTFNNLFDESDSKKK